MVDGYNIIFAWEDLKELAKENIEAARGKLMDVLCNYQGYRKMTLILVFDAYKVPGYTGEVQKYHNIYVVYTKEAETADQYIEKTVHEISKEHQVDGRLPSEAGADHHNGTGGKKTVCTGASSGNKGYRERNAPAAYGPPCFRKSVFVRDHADDVLNSGE